VASFVEIKIRDYRPSYQCRGLVDRIRRQPKTRALSPLKSFRQGIIEDCYVAPSLRRQGIGGQLVSSAVKWLQTKELNRIELSLLARNEIGEIFWKKLGFRVYRLSLFVEI